jgi:hypothetical protein
MMSADLEHTITELKRRLQVLEDKEALAALVNRYCLTADTDDWEGWAAGWTEDGESAAPLGTLKGREPITENAAKFHAGNKVRQHTITNMQFEVSGDNATGTASLIFFGVPDESEPGQHYDMGGPYNFQFRRTHDGWRIHRMELDIIWTMGEPWPDASD